MSEPLDLVTAHVQKAVAALQDALPDCGFIVIGLTDLDGEPLTGVSVASNIDDDAFNGTLTALVNNEGEDIPYPLPSSMLN